MNINKCRFMSVFLHPCKHQNCLHYVRSFVHMSNVQYVQTNGAYHRYEISNLVWFGLIGLGFMVYQPLWVI